MYRVPSRKSKRQTVVKPNLIPILDAVFIFIFFLLMSASFIKIYEIPSDVPLVSDQEPPPNKKPLALTLKITDSNISVYTGIPSRAIRSFGKDSEGNYDLESLHTFIVKVKADNPTEKTAILEPLVDITYEEIVKIMDALRVVRNTDESIYVKGKDGTDEKLKTLFDNIVFGNIISG